jgi:hypothetical protein
MYHDQALIPVKTIAFDEGVNVTLGLPFIRTSPDHGTAYSTSPARASPARQPDRRSRSPAAGAEEAAGMSAIDPLPPLREVIRRHGLMAKKALGQNFLLDLNLTAKIARIGRPARRRHRGRGRARARRPHACAAGRRSGPRHRHRARPALPAGARRDRARYPGRLEVIEGDALAVDLRPL